MRHGGARKNSGRKPLPAEEKAVYKTLGVRMPLDTFEQLDTIASRDGVTKSEIVRQLVEKFIESNA